MLARRDRVGASEVGCLLDEHPYLTKAALYLRITQGVSLQRTSARMQLGSDLEDTIARLLARDTGLKVRRSWRTYLHPTVPLAATPDYYLPPDGLLEVKLSGDWELWRDGLPPYVEWQVRAQLACANRQTGMVVVLLNGALRHFEVQRDLEQEERMLTAVVGFFAEHVTPRIPPDDPAASGELLLTIARPAGADSPTHDEQLLGVALAEVTGQRQQYEKTETVLRDQLSAAMATRGVRLLVGSGWRAEAITSKADRVSLRFTAVNGRRSA
jgi:predicted phage-related endonuclease